MILWNRVLFWICLRVLKFPSQFIHWVEACISSPMFSIVINGELQGFFQGNRGLRQGDPLSPYLFLLVMEGFTGLLQYRAKQSEGFVFHPKCRSLNITHLIFADDLFVLSGADARSFQLVADALSDFFHFSGLQPNLQKSSIFFARLDETSKESLRMVLPIPEGFLPVKYLGVPLITTRNDCVQLTDKTLTRIQSWSNKTLSYGGRLQLIHSVLFSIQIYWASIFILPQE